MYGELQQGNRMVGRPRKRYKDSLKDALKSCNVPLQSWETRAEDRASWRTAIHTGVQSFEAGRTERIRQARLRRKWPDQAVMQQDSHVMCVNGPVRAERVWWPLGEYIDGDTISAGKGHLRNRRVIHYIVLDYI